MGHSMRRFLIAVFAGGLLLASPAFAAALLWGPLQPFSPWVVGFDHHDTDRARIYYHNEADLALFEGIDGLIAGVESRHGISFPNVVDIFACGSDAEYRRLASTGSRFCVLPGYGRLYASARALRDAEAGQIHLETYLTHELSHSLLFQNMALVHFIGFPDWLLEGLAVFNADQRGVDGYCTREEVQDLMRQGHFLHPSDFTAKPWHKAEALKTFDMPNKYWFIYSELACFVEDLVEIGGPERFTAFERGLMNGEDEKALFEEIYGQPFDDFVEGFRQRMTNTGA